MSDTVTLSRDLAQLVLENLYDLRGERDWWKKEPRAKYQRKYQTLCDEIKQLESILGNEPP